MESLIVVTAPTSALVKAYLNSSTALAIWDDSSRMLAYKLCFTYPKKPLLSSISALLLFNIFILNTHF